MFRKRGDVLEIFPVHMEDRAWRIQLFGDELESIQEFDPLTGKKTADLEEVTVYAASHYVTPRPSLNQAITASRPSSRRRSTGWSRTASCWRPSASNSASASIWR
jgi:excinuclease UvrABC helicase subunit UvrB